MKKHEELWNKIRNFIRSITNNPDNYDEKYLKIRFDLYGDLLLKETQNLHEGNKYYQQVSLD